MSGSPIIHIGLHGSSVFVLRTTKDWWTPTMRQRISFQAPLRSKCRVSSSLPHLVTRWKSASTKAGLP